MFKRRRAVEDFDDAEDGTDDVLGERDSAPETTVLPAEPPGRPEGPWDVEDAPTDDLLDLGGMRVPIVDGFDLSITAEGDVPVVVTYGASDGLMQVHAFAAPKTAGIWDEVRTEIAESLLESGGSAEHAAGSFGTELRATIPVKGEDGTDVWEPARFLGIDGPRWFLRALITGPLLNRPDRLVQLEEMFRRIVVVRGGEAMAPRDIIPLRLPREAAEAMAAQAASTFTGPGEPEQPEQDLTTPYERPVRGPEITETR